MQSYENGAVIPIEQFSNYKEEKYGNSPGHWLKHKTDDTVFYAKYFQPSKVTDTSSNLLEDKLFAFIEFISSSLFRRLLGPNKTPNILLLASTATEAAIGSLRLNDFQTIYSLREASPFPNIEGDIGFEEYVAASIYLGNLDWANGGNFGLKDGKIAAIDFAYSFTLKFSTAATFLTYLSLKINLCKQYNLTLNSYLEFNLHRFIAAIERVLATTDDELLAKMQDNISTFTKGCGFVWDVGDEHKIVLDQTKNAVTEPTLKPIINEPDNFAQFAGHYLAEQRCLFEKVLVQLRIIAKFDKEAEYFNLEWLSHYSKENSGYLRIIEPLAYAAMRDLKIVDGDAKLDALDYAKKHNVRIFGSSNPLLAMHCFFFSWQLHFDTFYFEGKQYSLKLLGTQKPKYTSLDNYQLYAFLGRRSSCNELSFEPLAEVIIQKLNSIDEHLKSELSKLNIDTQRREFEAAAAAEINAINKVGSDLKRYKELYSIDIYLLLFITYFRFANYKNYSMMSNLRRVIYPATDSNNEFDSSPEFTSTSSLFIDSRFIKGVQQHCSKIVEQKVNYDYASRLLQFIGFQYISSLVIRSLKEHISLTFHTGTCIKLLSSIATFMFDVYQYPEGSENFKKEAIELQRKPIILFPSDFEANLRSVVCGDNCLIPKLII